MKTIVASFALVLVCHCGGKEGDGGKGGGPSTNPPDAASSEGGTDPGMVTGIDAAIDSGAACYGSGHGPPSSPPMDSRPSVTTCQRSGVEPDGGVLSCNTDADCPVLNNHCIDHGCGYDLCLTDSDCPPNQLCACGAITNEGDGLHPISACVPAECHTDADCGDGNYCIPSRGTCDVDGYYCTSSRDTCVDPTTDCACGGDTCVYTPVVGHFVCATYSCNG